MNALRAAAAGLLVLVAGCSAPVLGPNLDIDPSKWDLDPWQASTGPVGAYTRSRVADLIDCVPVSIGWGWGIAASARATPLFHVGLGLTPVTDDRWGFDDRIYRGHWREYETCFPWTPFLEHLGPIPPRPYGTNDDRTFGDGVPLVYRWQVARDGPYATGENTYTGVWEPRRRQWGRHPPNGRESGGAFIIPEYRRALAWHDLRLEQGDDEPLFTLGSPVRATLWEVVRDGPDQPQAWDLFQVDAFAVFIGARVGFRPGEFADFVLGIVGIDFAGDDIPVITNNIPIPPAAPTEAAPPAE